jgi:hypothetical protein
VRSAIRGIYEKRKRFSLQRKTFYQKRESEVKKILQTHTLPLFAQTMEDFDKVLLEKTMMEKYEVTFEN